MFALNELTVWLCLLMLQITILHKSNCLNQDSLCQNYPPYISGIIGSIFCLLNSCNINSHIVFSKFNLDQIVEVNFQFNAKFNIKTHAFLFTYFHLPVTAFSVVPCPKVSKTQI